MSASYLENGELFIEKARVAEIAMKWGTPCYIYSRNMIEQQWLAFASALKTHPHTICYAVKANSNIAILNILAKLGSGFDIVSLGELERVLLAGGDPNTIVFSGVGKQTHEMKRALDVGIACFNIESESELIRLNIIAQQCGKRAPISLRINPNVDAETHPYIATGLKENKFGIDATEALALYQRAAQMSHIEIKGIDCHIGSQLTSLGPFKEAIQRILSLIDELEKLGILIQHLDIGGGLGVRYRQEQPPHPEEYVNALLACIGTRKISLILEPGRAIVANAGILLTQVEYIKHSPHKNFAIVDAAMNDLLRPSLYNAWQDIVPVKPRQDLPIQTYDIVGPVCETGDWLGKDRQLAITEGDLLAVLSSGAYGFTMSSNYNSRPRIAELLVDGDAVHVIRERETIEDLWQKEHIPT